MKKRDKIIYENYAQLTYAAMSQCKNKEEECVHFAP